MPHINKYDASTMPVSGAQKIAKNQRSSRTDNCKSATDSERSTDDNQVGDTLAEMDFALFFPCPDGRGLKVRDLIQRAFFGARFKILLLLGKRTQQ